MSLLHSSLAQYDAIRRSPSADYLIHQLTAVEVQIEQLVAQLVNKVIGTPSSVTLMKYLAVQHLLKSDRSFVAALSSQSDMNRQYDVIRSHVIHPTTRVWLLKRIASWIDAESSRRQFFVVLGRTGTGKTALSSAVCKIFSKRVTSCYFLTDRSSSGDGNARTMRSLLFTLAHGLMSTRPEYLSYLDEKFGSSRLDEELKSLSWKQVYKTLIKEPLQLLYGSSTDAQRQSHQVVVVIDALDECKPDEWQDLSLLFNGLRRDLSVTVRLLITCRSKYSASILGQSILTDSECFCLEDRSWINAHIKDIETYIAHVLGYVLNEQSHRAKDDEVTLQNAIDELVKSSAGRFDFTVQLMSFFSREMKTTSQFLTSLKKASQTLDKTHGDLYRKKTTYFQSLFRAYRDKEGRAGACVRVCVCMCMRARGVAGVIEAGIILQQLCSILSCEARFGECVPLNTVINHFNQFQVIIINTGRALTQGYTPVYRPIAEIMRVTLLGNR
jgi:hypothetical protein